ncbi:penicillin-binding protein 2 [Prevotella veroralis]|uniref:Putative penicillin-binding protein 2 n=1 Tax=Prevotella veroralis F0319 TaxID=649761 RepID=C9MR34_9BACT|nr:penicillin-binding protein 2 [Prevotella veroralis]EEX18007.1 putative penicillin-binding protein 2 [Prevotella veroralis F0319]QUB40337.1 penicillin-binding protein 2 [Prevotella veroralis]
MKNYDLEKRRLVLSAVAIGIVVIYILRLFALQIASDDYRKSADSNAFLKKIEFPSRGTITDRNGKLLVYNQPAYDIMVVTNEMAGHLDTLDFCNALGITKADFLKRLRDIKDRNKNPGYSRFTQQLFMSQLSDKEFSAFQEKLYRFPGFYIQKRSVRQYQRPIAAHVLGDVAEVSQSDIEDDDYYQPGDYIGKMGVEREYEQDLRGRKGVQILLRDAHGRIQGRYKNGEYDQRPQPGRDLQLGLDADLQALGERLMEGKLGAIVAIEPKTGQVLAMVSSPTFDPRMMIGKLRGKYQRDLTLDPAKPLLNRAIMGQYPPGSTFKTSQAVTYYTEGIINDSTRYVCNHGFNFKGLHVGCHSHASPLALVPAISTSCNGYFCWGLYHMLSNRKKYKTLDEAMTVWRNYMVSMGFGYKLGIDLPGEKRGMIPNAQFYDHAFKAWNPLSVISISIGQGEVNLTPLQIANLGATIANRGYYITPHIVRHIEGKKLDKKYLEHHRTKGSVRSYQEVIAGMMSSVRGGTCAHAVHPGYSLAGKTGTAQNRGRDHSVFMGFAPVDTPKIAIAVYVENGGFGADYGVPIGSLMIEQYINGKLTPGDVARADALQKRHISYPFKRPLTHADSLRLDSIKRVNQIKDSLKMVNQKQEAAEAAKLKEAQQQKEAEEKERKKQPQNDPAIKVEPEELVKTEEKGKDKDKDKPEKDKERSREKERDKSKKPKEVRKESKDNHKDKQQKSKDNKAKDKPKDKSKEQPKTKSKSKENVNRGK